MDTFGENPRRLHATRLLTGTRQVTVPSLITAAFDSYLSAFARLIPIVLADYDALPASNPLRKTTGNLREVYFWPEPLTGHTERVYQPGK